MHLGDLDKTLQQKLEQDRKQIEALHQAELTKLRQNLTKDCQSVLNTIAVATQATKQNINTQLKWFLVLPFLTLISLLGGSLIGSWGMSQYLANQFKQIQVNSLKIQNQELTLELLKTKTWGLELYETSQGKFIILPLNSNYKTHWKCNNKPCLKL